MDIALSEEAARVRKLNRMADWIMGYYKKLGEPRFDINSVGFWDMVTEVIRVWGMWYPYEFQEMISNNAEDKKGEKTLSELVKLGFKKTVVYPNHFYALMKWVWPDAKMSSQEFSRKFARKFPIFRNSNYT